MVVCRARGFRALVALLKGLDILCVVWCVVVWGPGGAWFSVGATRLSGCAGVFLLG